MRVSTRALSVPRHYRMTSWIRAPATPKAAEKGRLLFETTDAGFCSNFNNYLYAYVYSLAEKKDLYVYDRGNAVSFNYPLIHDTFVDISGITFTDSMVASAASVRRNIGRVITTVNALPKNQLREAAQKLFAWNPALVQKAAVILKEAKLPMSFDLGVHIRAGDKITTREMNLISMDVYVKAIKAFQKKSGKDHLDIFVMSDSANSIAQLQKAKDASWTIHTVRSTVPAPEGHVQSSFNASPPRARLAAYTQFMAELIVIQSIPDILCTFSSHVGRFLYLTVEHPERVVSVDIPAFVAN